MPWWGALRPFKTILLLLLLLCSFGLQFFISGLYEHPAMKQFTYYLRIDSDAWFTKDIPCSINPFNLYGNRAAQASSDGSIQPLFFVYPARKPIALSACSEGLFDFIDTYRQAQGSSRCSWDNKMSLVQSERFLTRSLALSPPFFSLECIKRSSSLLVPFFAC